MGESFETNEVVLEAFDKFVCRMHHPKGNDKDINNL